MIFRMSRGSDRSCAARRPRLDSAAGQGAAPRCESWASDEPLSISVSCSSAEGQRKGMARGSHVPRGQRSRGGGALQRRGAAYTAQLQAPRPPTCVSPHPPAAVLVLRVFALHSRVATARTCSPPPAQTSTRVQHLRSPPPTSPSPPSAPQPSARRRHRQHRAQHSSIQPASLAVAPFHTTMNSGMQQYEWPVSVLWPGRRMNGRYARRRRWACFVVR